MGMFDFIPIWLALIFVALGLFGFLGLRFAKRVNKNLNLFGIPTVWLEITFLVIGILAVGGIGNVISETQGLFSGATASIGGVSTGAGVVSASQLDCTYDAGYGSGWTNTSALRTSTGNNKEVFIDLDESLNGVSETAGSVEASINVTCARATIGEDEAFKLVAGTTNYLSENDVSTANTYNIVELVNTPTNIWTEAYQREVYLSTSTAGLSTSAGDREEVNLAFAEATVEDAVTITVEADLQSYAQLNNQTTKDVAVYQRTDSGDRLVFTIHLHKVP